MESNYVDADFAVLRKWINEAQDREHLLLSEVDLLKQNLRRREATYDDVQGYVMQINQLRTENEFLKERVASLRMSRTYRIGAALREARSLNGMVSLPRRLFLLVKEKGGNRKNGQ